MRRQLGRRRSPTRHHTTRLRASIALAVTAVVRWPPRSMSERINADLVCQALRSACWQRKPPPELLLHSDRGAATCEAPA
ncbi:hypothetical protein DIE12_37080 [Burkholderia sp. Bp9015]|nr:hypothetical protein DIE12_37080 [Burkholderia sp. Bp9015]